MCYKLPRALKCDGVLSHNGMFLCQVHLVPLIGLGKGEELVRRDLDHCQMLTRIEPHGCETVAGIDQ